MGQVNAKFRSYENGFTWYCPACEELHPLPWKAKNGWSFDGNMTEPTFTPSFRHSGVQTVKENGRWTGEWVRDANGKALPFVCHYIITKGMVAYCGDCTHEMKNTTIQIPDLPPELCD